MQPESYLCAFPINRDSGFDEKANIAG
jgi:hypothetical protein